jgi:hypothetical protein
MRREQGKAGIYSDGKEFRDEGKKGASCGGLHL